MSLSVSSSSVWARPQSFACFGILSENSFLSFSKSGSQFGSSGTGGHSSFVALHCILTGPPVLRHGTHNQCSCSAESTSMGEMQHPKGWCMELVNWPIKVQLGFQEHELHDSRLTRLWFQNEFIHIAIGLREMKLRSIFWQQRKLASRCCSVCASTILLGFAQNRPPPTESQCHCDKD